MLAYIKQNLTFVHLSHQWKSPLPAEKCSCSCMWLHNCFLYLHCTHCGQEHFHHPCIWTLWEHQGHCGGWSQKCFCTWEHWYPFFLVSYYLFHLQVYSVGFSYNLILIIDTQSLKSCSFEIQIWWSVLFWLHCGNPNLLYFSCPMHLGYFSQYFVLLDSIILNSSF